MNTALSKSRTLPCATPCSILIWAGEGRLKPSALPNRKKAIGRKDGEAIQSRPGYRRRRLCWFKPGPETIGRRLRGRGSRPVHLRRRLWQPERQSEVHADQGRPAQSSRREQG